MRTKKLLGMSIIFASLSLVYFIFAQSGSEPNKEAQEQKISETLAAQLTLEREKLKKKEAELNRYRQNLESFESDLNKRYSEYLQKLAALEKREKDFNQKVEDTSLDQKTIESYENIDPEQAALLMQEMYKNDPKLPPLIIRKIAGKKAGKIIEALIELNTVVSAKLAKDVIDYYKPEGEK